MIDKRWNLLQIDVIKLIIKKKERKGKERKMIGKNFYFQISEFNLYLKIANISHRY